MSRGDSVIEEIDHGLRNIGKMAMINNLSL